MRKPTIPIAAAAASVCLGVGAAAACESATAPASPSAGDIDVQVSDSKERLGEYWTRDRMRAAKPMQTPRISRPAAEPAARGVDVDGE